MFGSPLRSSVFSWGLSGHKKIPTWSNRGQRLVKPTTKLRLTWCREDLLAEGHGAEEDGKGSSGDLHDSEQVMECGLECQHSQEGNDHSLLPVSS